ncbi:hypothetical protein [Mucilaginibacter sp. SP1R1]|uniref:hypothetical protein n=1 Tax=Mucilaginibacter sp. SP1R1 TaxID=2723091 RepID=UPI00161A6FFB|nr:hypothetical protein [Mucilaginibacter sp. SP1R1]MBB6150285.1 hypothetical protein [Mucilaginibacter sp. SP1R1]
MVIPENPNLDDAQDDKDPGNEFEQNEGQDTGNQLLNANEPNVSALEAASRASESAYTLNFEDGIAPRSGKQDVKTGNDKPGNTKQ